MLSLPFALAPAAMLTVIAYTAVMRGAPVLRGWLLAHMLALLPYASAMMLSPSIASPEVAERLFRVAAAAIPMATACGAGFQLALIRRYRRYRWLVWFLVANAAAWLWIGSTTHALVGGLMRLDGYWFPAAGRYAWLGLLHTTAIASVGFVALARVALASRPSEERRQQRAALLALLVTHLGLADVALSYGVGSFPLGWLLSGIGCALVARALVVEDLLRARAVDTALPRLVVHFMCAVLLAWGLLAQLGSQPPWWIALAVLAGAFATVRIAIATVSLIARGGRGGEGPLERLLAQLVRRARTLRFSAGIAQLAIDIIHLGVGIAPVVLLAAEDDWGWTDKSGERLADAAAPDPLLVGWLAAHGAPLFADDLEPVPPDLRELAAALLEHHAARAIVPVRSADELVALIALPAHARRLRGRGLAFVERAADRLAEALVHARMAHRAAARAALAREVELAAAVQAELLPGPEPHVYGRVTVAGAWRPATRCAGDFWAVYPIAGPIAGPTEPRVLVAIGDVTGHGVASAMVTAAVAGALDAHVRRSGAALELGALMAALDAAVRRVGGGELAMTCAAALLDPAAHALAFASCGHTAPYLCRPAAAASAIELHALVGRGNPLGAGVPVAPRVIRRPWTPGDLLVWYTDGVIDAQDPAGRSFGDRRFQQLLKRLDPRQLAPLAVRDRLQAAVAAHRAGQALADDETLVVAQLAPPEEAP